MLPDFADAVEEHETVKQVQAQGEAGDLFTLDECFQLYTQEEHVRHFAHFLMTFFLLTCFILS